MRKSLRVLASVDGWYSIKASCDEGTILVNMRLEANKPLDISFVNDRPPMPEPVKTPAPVAEKIGDKKAGRHYYSRRRK